MRTQECIQKVVLWHFQVFSNKTHPKHVPIPYKVSSFYLNPSHNKNRAFTSLKIGQNGRLKEKLENTHRSGPCILRKMVLWSVCHGRSPIQAYYSIPMGEITHISGEDVGTLLGLKCHWRSWKSLREKLRLKRGWDEREAEGFCRGS